MGENYRQKAFILKKKMQKNENMIAKDAEQKKA